MYSCMPVYMSSDDDIKSCMMTYSYHLLEINKYRNVLLAKHPSSSRTDITVISGGSGKGEYAALTMAVMSQGCHKLCHNPPEKAPCRIFSCNRRKSPLVLCQKRMTEFFRALRGWKGEAASVLMRQMAITNGYLEVCQHLPRMAYLELSRENRGKILK